MTKKAALAAVGSLGFPSKMPGTSYGLPASACKVGGILQEVKGSVCSNCYAMGGNYVYPDVAKSHATRLASIEGDYWVQAMAQLLTAAHERGIGKNGPFEAGYHRWHDSGDIQSIEHLAKICEVARKTPQLKHWLPTREAGIVKRYIAMGGMVPDNLIIRVSAAMVDGARPKAFMHTSGVHSFVPHRSPLNDAAPSFDANDICPASKQGNKCGPCRKCWDKNVEHVTYPLH